MTVAGVRCCAADHMFRGQVLDYARQHAFSPHRNKANPDPCRVLLEHQASGANDEVHVLPRQSPRARYTADCRLQPHTPHPICRGDSGISSINRVAILVLQTARPSIPPHKTEHSRMFSPRQRRCHCFYLGRLDPFKFLFFLALKIPHFPTLRAVSCIYYRSCAER